MGKGISKPSPVPENPERFFLGQNELFKYGAEIVKITTANNQDQKRSIVLTNVALYLFNRNSKLRRIAIENIALVIRTQHESQ